MDQEVIDRYLLEVPFEIRNAIKPLDNDKSWAILIVLLKNGKMRFSDIKTTFKANSSGEINRYLNRLADGGLIEKYSMKFKDIGNAEKTYYRPTNLSKTLVNALFENLTLKPKVPEQKPEYELITAINPSETYTSTKGGMLGSMSFSSSTQSFTPLNNDTQQIAGGHKNE
jgi:hypothetical protein